jgi:peptide/nickel transport system permease protein
MADLTDPIASELAEQAVGRTDGRRRRAAPRWFAWRIAQGIGVVLVASVLIFAITAALPGDPARSILGKDATPESVASLRQDLGLDRPLVSQYVTWMGTVVQGSFGTSLLVGQVRTDRRSVASLVLPRLVNSLTLLLLAAIVSIPLAIALGVLSAVRREGMLDKGALWASLMLAAVPEFVVGIGVVVLFATSVFTIFPSVVIIPSGSTAIAQPEQLVLPVLTLVLIVVPYPYRLARAGMLEALRSEYVTMARLKGVPARRIVSRHALPNATIPVVQALGICLVFLLGGIVVVEFVFGFPGLGTLLTISVQGRDLRTVQACALIYAAGVVVINILADAVTLLATPTARTRQWD